MSNPSAAPGEAVGDEREVALQALSALGTASAETSFSDRNLNDLLRSASRNLRRLLDCETARVWVLRRGGRRLVAREFPDGNPAAPVEMRLDRGEGLAGWVVREERTLRLGEGERQPDLTGKVPPFRNALVHPLFRRGDVFGAVECLNRRGHDFTDEDFDRLDVAAEHVAFALDNALLYEETERRALEKEVLLEVSKVLATPLDLAELLETIFRTLRQVVDYDAAAIYLVNRRTRDIELVSETGFPPGSEEAFRLQVGQGIVGWVANSGEPVIVPDVERDSRYVAAREGTRSELAAPLRFEGRTIGVFNLESDLVDAYHEGHLELLTAFAAQAAVAVERARTTQDLLERRRLEKELAIAREIQRSFLPQSAPRIAGFDLAGTTLTHDEVGGDYFDFIRISDTRLGVAIADVSGKGIPAALLMAGFRMSLLAEIRNEFAIRAVMRKANTLLHESTERDKFVTAFYGVLDHRNRVLIFSNAGHNPPILVRADDSVEHLIDGGVALGVLPEAHYEERPLALRDGDVLVLYTDGVSEAETSDNHLFGTGRLEAVVREHRGETATGILEAIVAAVHAWTGERGPNDDLTLIVIKVLPQEAGRTA
jgi:serine phosphatase RsbU (regulator of sigma subunit)